MCGTVHLASDWVLTIVRAGFIVGAELTARLRDRTAEIGLVL